MPQSTLDDVEIWYAPQEAGPRLGVAPQTLANWRVLGMGPAYIKISPGRAGRVRYSESAIRAWLAEREVTVA